MAFIGYSGNVTPIFSADEQPRSLMQFLPSAGQKLNVSVSGSDHIEILLDLELTGLNPPEESAESHLDYLKDHIFMEIDGVRLSNENMTVEQIAESNHVDYFIFWEYKPIVGRHQARLVIQLDSGRTTEFEWSYHLIP